MHLVIILIFGVFCSYARVGGAQFGVVQSSACYIHVFGANFHLVQNRLKVDVTPISINSVNKLVG